MNVRRNVLTFTNVCDIIDLSKEQTNKGEKKLCITHITEQAQQTNT